VQTKSYGEEKPAVVGANEGAWSKNRRGEFAVFAKKQ
jgi:outer membrane protein OmpA-like peptidoglycan-associated protein